MAERPRRRSRVLDYFEQQQQAQREQEEADAEQEAANNPDEAPQAGGEAPFREFDLAFGPDFFASKGNE